MVGWVRKSLRDDPELRERLFSHSLELQPQSRGPTKLDRKNPRELESWVAPDLSSIGVRGSERSISSLKIGKQSRQGARIVCLEPPDPAGSQLDPAAFAALLRNCGSSPALSDVKRVHRRIVKNGFGQNVFLGNLLVQTYGKIGALDNARAWFSSMHQRNQFSWNFIISAYVRHGQNKEALQLFDQMLGDGVGTDKFVCATILSAYSCPSDLAEGQEMHAHIICCGFEADLVVATALVNMYSKCGSLENARKMFDNWSKRNVVMWTAMIAAYAQHSHGREAFQLYHQMQEEAEIPDKITVVSILDACASLTAATKGKQVHSYLRGNGLEADVVVATALVNMYAKCGDIKDARSAFNQMYDRNVISWTVMITGYFQHGHTTEALQLFDKMQQEGLNPNRVTFVCVLDACTGHASLADYKQVHKRIVVSGFEADVAVGTALVNTYDKFGSLEDAQRIFDRLPERNLVSWNAMIGAYVQHGHNKDAFRLFKQMQQGGVVPDNITLASILSACASQAAFERGKRVHHYIIHNRPEIDIELGTALVSMYGKCGDLKDAQMVFDKLPSRDVVCWTAMIAAYAQHGKGKRALRLFRKMKQEELEPNQITFVNVLIACRHSGLVDEGRRLFTAMQKVYALMPTAEHYDCMIDLLGRAGRVDEAETLLNKMPFKPTIVSWTALLGACRIKLDVARGERAAHHIFEIDSSDASSYVTLSNIYAAAGRDRDAENVLKTMKEKCMKKVPGRSSIEVKGDVHEFVADDQVHPQKEKIYKELERLSGQMRKAGYVLDSKLVFCGSDDERKHRFCSHSERLAIAFGFISTPPGTPILITKNLRVCPDCHSATKFISKMTSRKIVIRDAHRFHQFKNGVCSCSDYW